MKCQFGELHSVSSVSLDYDINMNPKLFSYADLNFSNLMNKLFFLTAPNPSPTLPKLEQPCLHVGLYLDSYRSFCLKEKSHGNKRFGQDCKILFNYCS